MLIEKRWTSLCKELDIPEKIFQKEWSALKKLYSEQGRHYHNLQHVDYMVHESLSMVSKIKDPKALHFAIFYHDAIYDPRAKDNELKSGESAESFLEPFDPQLAKKVKRMIISTERHQSSDMDPDTLLFLDLDLLILSRPDRQYLDYQKKIRKEYSWVSDFQYKKGRIEVLNGFLKRERIYYTEDFFTKHEHVARENIQKEISLLSTGKK